MRSVSQNFSSQITSLALPDAESILTRCGGSSITRQRIYGLSRVNIFIGANNSGKSFLLREILKTGFTHENDSLALYHHEIASYLSKLENLLTSSETGLRYIAISSQSPLFRIQPPNGAQRILQLETSEFIEIFKKQFVNKDLESIPVQLAILKHLPLELFQSAEMTFLQGLADPKIHLQTVFTSFHDKSLHFIEDSASQVFWLLGIQSRLYIPVLRTLRNYSNTYLSKSDDQVLAQISERSSQELSLDYTHIVDGQGFFRVIFENNNSSMAGRKRVAEYEAFLSEYFFDNKEITLITNVGSGKDHQRYQVKISIAGEERFLDQMGDGVQQLIILTYPFFFYESGAVVIEEPEMNLEPRLQRKIMEFFVQNERSQNFVIFIATHSNNIIDSALVSDCKVHIFRVAKIRNEQKWLLNYPKPSGHFPHFQIDEATPQVTQTIMHDIGARPSSLLLANGLIWVEGPSDIIYIDTWLQLLQKQVYGSVRYRRGNHYEFQMYGGSLLKYYYAGEEYRDTELNRILDLMKINPHCFVVMDSDVDIYGQEIVSLKEGKDTIEAMIGSQNIWRDPMVPTIEFYIPQDPVYWKLNGFGKPYWDSVKPGKVRKNLSKTAYSLQCAQIWQQLLHQNTFSFADFAPTLLPHLKQLLETIERWNS